MSENAKIYTNVEPFWQVQGSKSFCKAKGDWIDFKRIHLSFVRHNGKPDCKQEAAIEGAVKLEGADGALFLAEMILSGAAKKLAARSKQEAAASGNYPKAFFESMGGTVASRSSDGKCQFRQFSVAPGMKSDYVFTMVACEGQENRMGGIQPVQGAARTRIDVPLSAGDLFCFASCIRAEHTAQRVFIRLKDKGAISDKTNIASQNREPAATALVAATPTKGMTRCILYDTSGYYNNGLPKAVLIEGAEKLLQDITRILLYQGNFVADKASYISAVKFINESKKGHTIVNFNGKMDESKSCSVVVVVDNID